MPNARENMQLDNRCGLPAGWTLGFRRDGRELLIVIIKGTFSIPEQNGPCTFAPEQVPLVKADEFTGDPGASAPLYETDYAHTKLGCDVLLVGHAYAPDGRPAVRSAVELKVAGMMKRFGVIGRRTWQQRAAGVVVASSPESFERVPLTYDYAWGGTDRSREAVGQVDCWMDNPVGRGYCRRTEQIDGMPLPQTEVLGAEITRPNGTYRAQALSPIGRNWTPRYRYAGKYDAHWLRTRAPLWPDDFDERYFQAAPSDQVVSLLRGGEMVEMRNLSPSGGCAFTLPAEPMPVTFIPHRGRDITREAQVDTLVLEPDKQQFTMTWRCVLPLGNSIFDVREVIVGELPAAWHRARRFPGKRYFPSLAEAVCALKKRSAS